ncbi:MAG: 30S ribosomal protein S5, partial [Myxococcales bacterium]|nr:30S ribosomal protein S5 [Myxococcales bacterium]
DGKGHVGVGLGKANEVPDAIRKGNEQARKHLFRVPLMGTTVPHRVHGHFGAGYVVLRPAGAGTGVIAGGAMRPVLEMAGVRDVLAKILGTANPHNVVHATLNALQQLEGPEAVSERRGRTVQAEARV